MSTVTRPRGPLPPRVYWFRRLLVLGLALGLVFGLNQLLGSKPSGAGPSARPASASASSTGEGTSPAVPSTPDAAGAAGPATAGVTGAPTNGASSAGTPEEQTPTAKGPGRAGRKARKAKAPLAAPSGPCADTDVVVTPAVGTAYAGRDVALTLDLTTREAAACTWEVSADSLVLRLTSGDDRIWSTQDCPAAVTRQSVVVRKEHVTSVQVTWSGRRSDAECSRSTDWALPGYYHATAAAFGGEPASQQFELQAPPRPTITPTPTAKPERGKAENRRDGEKKRD